MGKGGVKNSWRNSGVGRREVFNREETGTRKRSSFINCRPSPLLPGPASLSQTELKLITSVEYIMVFMGHGLGAAYCSQALHTS